MQICTTKLGTVKRNNPRQPNAQIYHNKEQERDVHESVHRDTITKVTNKMQLYRLIYYS